MLLFFIIWKLFDVVISLLAPFVIPYLGFFPYKDLLVQYHFPDFLSHLASFDGVHYTQIADNGYAQNEQAFFPLYPLLIKALTFVTHNRLASGLLIANISFLIGLIVFQKYLKIIFPKNKSQLFWTFFFLLVFPTSFFFGAVYTEGLFFLLFILSLYFLKKKNYWLAGLFAAFSSLTRLIGIFLVIPFLFSFFYEKRLSYKHFFSWVDRHILLVLSPFVGFSLYCIYLWKTVGDPLFFFHAQPSFGANRSTHLILLPQVYFRYVKIFFTAQFNFQYFTSLVEFVFFTFVLVVLILDLIKNLKLKVKNFDRIALNLFSFANLLLPTLTGTFSSVPRYVLFSVSVFLFLGEIKSTRVKFLLGLLFAFFHIMLFGFFIQGYFVG